MFNEWKFPGRTKAGVEKSGAKDIYKGTATKKCVFCLKLLV